MKVLLILLIFIFNFFLIGCTQKEENVEALTEEDLVVSETAAGDFILRLVSKNAVYEAGEPITIVGKLKYRGNKEELVITYANSPFTFDIIESTRGVEIPFAVRSTFRNTILEYDQWYEEEYDKQALPNDNNDKTAVFMSSYIKEEGFPPGEYEVEVRSEFMINTGQTKEDHSYTTSILLDVKELN
ncbi:hypothetical protein CR203_19915 [Salipaludibacillus neizhouensis]|uniref:Uncharacterized protein n=1 Tax=Salipaludibacillus neizhouensis TaxID=885475 RepID=A0A3A9K3Y7_9BACI|nr:hypothetical protein [Salipaludibacillus neizhouensis]RKL65590.1 hypothetical protein CR203_19915 [Salipaludibacillus neizhouensis]